jgi:hypothetical protein
MEDLPTNCLSSTHQHYFKSGLAAEIESIGTIKKYEQLMTNCLWKTYQLIAYRVLTNTILNQV